MYVFWYDAIFQNYLVVVEPDGVTKYGLVQGKHGHERLSLPPSEKSGKITQLSATPRHLLAVTADGGNVWIIDCNVWLDFIIIYSGSKLI